MARRHLGLLLLALGVTSALAKEVGFADLFKPYPPRRNRGRQVMARMASKGVGPALRHIHRFERAIDEVQKRFDAANKTYQKNGDKWWGWRTTYERNYRRKHKRPPADYPTPQGINKIYIASELAFKKARADKLQERLFQEAVLQQIGARLKTADDRALAGLRVALGARAALTRVRAAELLALVPADGAVAVADAALAGERHPVVLQRLLAVASPAAVAPFLGHAAWPVRSGAIARVKDEALLRARLPLEKGRLLGELHEALGETPPAHVPWFNKKVHAHAAVFCIEATAAAAWPVIRDQTIRALDAMPDGGMFGIVVLERKVVSWKRRLQPLNPGTRAAAKKFLEGVEPDGVADVYEGLRVAVEMTGAGGTAPAKIDTMFLGLIRAPAEAQTQRAVAHYVDPRQVMLEFLPLNAVRGLKVHAFGPSGGGESFYLQGIVKAFGGTLTNPG
ncbi:MAG: hypothetical protein OER88_09760 [Planctomycetota bacterium]|nr:hypothetical protein [Planctomycetota bacterium]